MKKFILLFALGLTLPFNAFSQIEKPITKGNKIIGGSTWIIYSKSSEETFSVPRETTYFNVSIDPEFGYFIIDNLAIGFSANLGFDKVSDRSSYALGIGPYAKYYFNNGLTAQVKTDYSKYFGSTNSHQFVISPGIGYAIFLNSKVSLEPTLYYRFQKYDGTTYNVRHNLFQLGITLNIFL